MSKKSHTRRNVILGTGATIAAGVGGYFGYKHFTRLPEAYKDQPNLRQFTHINYSNNNINLSLDEIPTRQFGQPTTMFGFNKQILANALDIYTEQIYFLNIKNNLKEPSSLLIPGIFGHYGANALASIAPGQTGVCEVDTSRITQQMFSFLRPMDFENGGRQLVNGLTMPVFVKYKPTIPPRRDYFPDNLPQYDLFITGLTVENGMVKQNSDPYKNGQEGNTILVNGDVRPKLLIPQQSAVRFRVTNATLNQYLLFDFAENNEIWLYGTDNGYINEPRLLKELFLVPGARLDIMVYFKSKDSVAIKLRNYNRGLGDAVIANTILMDIFFQLPAGEHTHLPVKISDNEQLGNPVSSYFFDITAQLEGDNFISYININGEHFDNVKDQVISIKQDSVYELKFRNTAAFDITMHFSGLQVQLKSSTGQANKENTFTAFRDVINLTPNETVIVMLKPKNIGNYFIYAANLPSNTNNDIIHVEVI